MTNKSAMVTVIMNSFFPMLFSAACIIFILSINQMAWLFTAAIRPACTTLKEKVTGAIKSWYFQSEQLYIVIFWKILKKCISNKILVQLCNFMSSTATPSDLVFQFKHLINDFFLPIMNYSIVFNNFDIIIQRC